MFWLTDPKTGEKSVTVTLLLFTYIATLGATALKMYGKLQDVSSIQQMLYAFMGLYFGRKVNVKTKNIEMTHHDQKVIKE